MSNRQNMRSALRDVSPPDGEELDELLYPSSDGEPVGETDWHFVALMLLRQALEDFFAERADVYVASDLFLYYRRDDGDACVAPDAMVVKGVARRFRRVFKTWTEKALPCAVFELSSRKTRKQDLGEKLSTYAGLGIREYFVFDPQAKVLDPPLRGFRLRGRNYQALKPNVRGELSSKELGLRLVREDYMLRLIDAATGQPVPTREEAKAVLKRQAEEQRQQAEEQRQRAEEQRQRAEEQRQQAEEQRQRAEQAEERAAALETELAELRARFGNRRGGKP